MRAFLLAASLALAACSPGAGDRPGTAPTPGSRYVALGSSFAAGTGLGAPKPGTPARCGRSEASYPTLLARRFGLALDDQSCGGATTAHVLGPWGELPPQIEAVTPETRLVTITIGGNDLNYVANLLAATCRPGEGFALAGRRIPCLTARAPEEADFVQLETNLREIARQVGERAPCARLVFIQYLTLVPDSPCDASRLSSADAEAGRAVGRRLAEITARVARASGAILLTADELSRNHTPCDAEPWVLGPAPGPEGGIPWHPNATGMNAIANALAERLGWSR